MKKAKRNILKIIILISSVAALIFVVTMYLDSPKDKNKNDASVVVSATSETSSQVLIMYTLINTNIQPRPKAAGTSHQKCS